MKGTKVRVGSVVEWSRVGLALTALALSTLGVFSATNVAHGTIDAVSLRGTVRTPSAPDPVAIDVMRIEGVDYLDLNVVARVFHCTKYWRAELEKMVLKVGRHRVRLTVGSAFVFVDDEGHNLFAPVRWWNGRLVVPSTLTTEVIDPLVAQSVSWDPARLQLQVDSGAPNIVDLDYDIRTNGTVTEIRLTEQLAGEIDYHRAMAEVRIPGGVLSSSLLGTFSGVGLIDSVVAQQHPDRAELRLYLGPTAGAPELLGRSSPPRLVVAIPQVIPDDIPSPEFDRGTERPGDRDDVRVVTLDPGHGGSDTGILSPTGVAEKDITLSVATKLAELLTESGFDVRLTRETDEFLAPRRRAEFANGAESDLFVSIHCNGWFSKNRKGFSMGLPLESKVPTGAEISTWGERTSQTTRRAELFSQILSEELETATGMQNRGVTIADFAMIEGATMPALLLECGMLTNLEEGSLLSDPGFHDAIASAALVAIENYRSAIANGAGSTP